MNQRTCEVSEKQCRLLLLALVGLGVFLRLHDLARWSLWYDEGGTLQLAKYVNTSFEFLDPQKVLEIPLFLMMARFWKMVIDSLTSAGPGDVTYDFLLRLLPCIAGILAIPMTFLTAKTIFKNRAIALAATLLFVISPFQIYYAQELRAYSFSVLFITTAIYSSLQALETDAWRYWVALVLFMALTLYNHFTSVWYFLAFNVYVLLTMGLGNRRVWKWLASQCVMSVISLPAIYIAHTISATVGKAEAPFYPDLPLKIVPLTYKAFFAGYSASVLSYKVLFVLAFLFIALACWRLRKTPTPLVLLLLLAVVPVAAQFITWRTKSTMLWYFHRHTIFSATPCYILVAYGMCALRHKAAALGAAAVFAAFTFPCLADLYAQRLHPIELHWRGARYKVDNRSASNYVKAHRQSDDLVTHTSSMTMFPWKGHYFQEIQPVLCFTEQDRIDSLQTLPCREVLESQGIFPVRAGPLLRDAERLWLIQSWWSPAWYTTLPYGPRAFEMSAWMDGQAVRLERKEFDGITTFLYATDFGLRIETATSQVADFGENTLLFHQWPAAYKKTQHAATWKESFAASARNLPYDKPDTFGVHWGQPDGGALSALAQTATEDNAAMNVLTDVVTLINGSEIERTIECSVFRPALSVDALSLHPIDLDSDVWRPRHSFEHRPFPHQSERLCLEAQVGPAHTINHGIIAFPTLAPGPYHVFAKVYRPKEGMEASLRFAALSHADLGELKKSIERDIQDPMALTGSWLGARTIGLLSAPKELEEHGWRWEHVGTCQWTETVSMLTVVAECPASTTTARARLQDIVFVRGNHGSQPVYGPSHTFEIRLAPHERNPYTLSTDFSGADPRPIHLDLVDKQSGVFRKLSFRRRHAE